MRTTTETTNGEIRELTREEARALLDRETRRYLGMSVEEFVHAWNDGKFDEDPDQPEIMHVAMLLPLVQ